MKNSFHFKIFTIAVSNSKPVDDEFRELSSKFTEHGSNLKSDQLATVWMYTVQPQYKRNPLTCLNEMKLREPCPSSLNLM
jgi:hypothetical protein